MPGQPALISVGQGTVTWSELWKNSRQWGAWLGDHDVAPGDRVVTMLPQSLEANYVWMGCCVLGAVEVSVNCEFRGEWLRNALRTSSAKAVVTSKRFLDQLLPLIDGSGIETIFLYDDAGGNAVPQANVRIMRTPPEPSPSMLPDSEPNTFGHDLACVLYTSGTTGPSKAAQVAWAQLHMTWIAGVSFERQSPQIYYFPYAPCHLAGRGALYRAALTGGRSVIRETFSTSSFWEDVRGHGCTWALLYASPTRFIVNLPERPDDAQNTLELVLMCPVPRDVDAIKSRFAFEVFSTYGMTEIGVPFVVAPADAISVNTGCCGRPIEGIEAMLSDEHDYPVAPGTPGELLVRSREPWRLTRGYLGAPEATAKAWRNGWFHTGDIFRVDENGNYFYQDRAKDMIRRRGENISSFELEAAVLTHPDVQEAAAVGVLSEVGDEEVLVAVVPRSGSIIDPAQLVAHLKEIVPRFAVPRYLRVLDALPKTMATMKVQKQALRAAAVTSGTWDRSVPTAPATA
jgi:crotonobetaine/carnitine-CoA ligase